ncbi:protein numb isoform X2 [Adelges cooleyi]|nr:protein numb isoform X2 [Adelges cooleyi]XP_050442113.1 protein numb isoform X2 [Adelges cooleyi]
MDRLRRSFRDSFRRRKDLGNHTGSPGHHSNPKPHLWAMDEAEVRAGICSFHVKYLGCVEVFESRGMEVCEEALKTLRASRRRPVRAIFYISGDGLRVVEEETKGLIVDQTIEKVSFCAPDRSHEKGFSYICRDGLTRRWMCHGFVALKESGDRLSHAVGCAFQECLIRKNKREEECSVTMTYDQKTSVFTRTGSFRAQSLTEQQTEPNIPVNAPPQPPPFLHSNSKELPVSTVKPLQQNITTPKISTKAIERPHATLSMLQRQGSFRGFSQLNQASPFKRQLSLRISELPSNLERTRSMSLQPTGNLQTPSNKFMELSSQVSPIPEVSPHSEKSMSTTDQVTAMCQQMSLELAFLTNSTDNDDFPEKFKSNDFENTPKQGPITGSEAFLASISKKSSFPHTQSNPSTPKPECRISPQQDEGFDSGSSLWNLNNKAVTPPTPPATPPSSLPRPEQWLGKVAAVTLQSTEPQVTPKRHPHLAAHSRAYSLDTAEDVYRSKYNSMSANPFDPNYIAPKQNTNPFLSSPIAAGQNKTVKTFEVQM